MVIVRLPEKSTISHKVLNLSFATCSLAKAIIMARAHFHPVHALCWWLIPFYALNSNCNTITSNCNFFRPEMVVGWYHSHPGFGCWLSGVDINTQQVFYPLYLHNWTWYLDDFLICNVDCNKNVYFKPKMKHFSGLAFMVREFCSHVINYLLSKIHILYQ